MGRVAIIDTSLLCCWVDVPGRATAGSPPDRWDRNRTEAEIRDHVDDGFELILPITTLIEAGNHIAHSSGDRYVVASRFTDIIEKSTNGERPWTPFLDNFVILNSESLNKIVSEWPEAAARNLSLGDFLITLVADYYAKSGFLVRILSSDAQLRSYVPMTPVSVPRRRRRTAS